MGSKSKICESVCTLFPKADHFYDLFGGGFSITHFMLENRKKDFKEFHFNELRPGICDLIKNAISGKYSYENELPCWISREEFSELKDSDPYIKILWSFGNIGAYYIFGKDIEQRKKSLHMAVVFNEFDQFAKDIFGMDKFKEGYSINAKRLVLKNRLRFLSADRLDLEQLERLEQLQRLKRLEQLEHLHFHEGCYSSVEIKKNSVIYCDIPYIGTGTYDNNSGFNRQKFLDWAAKLDQPVFISEYLVEDNRFECVLRVKKRALLRIYDVQAKTKVEKVYVNKAGLDKLRQGSPRKESR